MPFCSVPILLLDPFSPGIPSKTISLSEVKLSIITSCSTTMARIKRRLKTKENLRFMLVFTSVFYLFVSYLSNKNEKEQSNLLLQVTKGEKELFYDKKEEFFPKN